MNRFNHWMALCTVGLALAGCAPQDSADASDTGDEVRVAPSELRLASPSTACAFAADTTAKTKTLTVTLSDGDSVLVSLNSKKELLLNKQVVCVKTPAAGTTAAVGYKLSDLTNLKIKGPASATDGIRVMLDLTAGVFFKGTATAAPVSIDLPAPATPTANPNTVWFWNGKSADALSWVAATATAPAALSAGTTTGANKATVARRDVSVTNTGTLVFILGAGNDSLNASAATVPVRAFGGAGDDVLIGGSANDLLDGGEGNDTLDGKAGCDGVKGGDGDDTNLDFESASTVAEVETNVAIGLPMCGQPDPEDLPASGGSASVGRAKVAAGAECAKGGFRFEHGIDDNNNGTLEDAEVDGSTLACNGNPPTLGTSISFDGSSGALISVSWGQAADEETAASLIEYKVVYSTSNNISTVESAESNGTVVVDWSRNITSAILSSGIEFDTTYYVAVLVRNGIGRKALYAPVAFTTASSGPSSLGCPSGSVVVGVYGRTGAWFDKLGVRCATVSGTTVGAPSAGGSVGGEGGEGPFSYDCPAGAVVVNVSGDNLPGGEEGGSAPWCSNISTITLRVLCHHLATGQLLTPSPTFGGNAQCKPGGGDGAFSYACSAGRFMVGLIVSADSTGLYAGNTNGIVCR